LAASFTPVYHLPCHCDCQLLESYGFRSVTFSDSDVISSGLVLGHAFQNSGSLSPCFIVLLPHWHGSVNGKSYDRKGKMFNESVYFNAILKDCGREF
jgi:hypothetical protein